MSVPSYTFAFMIDLCVCGCGGASVYSTTPIFWEEADNPFMSDPSTTLLGTSQ
ncbi:hypothetical protein PF010_g16468 [Phytophthora fragariae]|uniref:Uncharacterized protein n=1 Tax=Phytophthora fragariae TaxID=53985 RepID=A0A6G0KQY5_9STRA|nr:hypothetical protein PF010_g16468 [Phytophthora fragariae]KAE9216461.1 hypothetical protein PF004_g14445 [Phytophthora fragariae]